MQVANTILPEAGGHVGVIHAITEQQKNFGSGPEDTVTVEILATDVEGGEVIPIAVEYAPALSLHNALGRFIQACGAELTPGVDFDLQSLVGTDVAFEVVKKDNGFLAIPKASISAV